MLPTALLACKLIAFSQAVGNWKDRPVYVNPCFVSSVTSTGPDMAMISISGKEPVVVRGQADRIAEMLNAATQQAR
ncbi:hypothetical protein [Enterovirga aerilata]|uniref:Uncharacterized protein n=1 Tax=Enterovirga aerilata TaxID=2730920 RepID=A0A849I5G4_9HYPH|nr:hypothetical protein [Enterovirga sp. DB1703]NNM72571.1 hypothetical protein [Enterovirga sp. DB1703]